MQSVPSGEDAMTEEKDTNGQKPMATEGRVEVKPSFTETAQVRALPAAPLVSLAAGCQ